MMRHASVLVGIVLCLAIVGATARPWNWPDAPDASVLSDPLKLQRSWSAFKSFHQRHYDNAEEEAARFAAFRENLRHLKTLNLRNPQAHFRLNKFADMTKEEFAGRYLLRSFTPKVANAPVIAASVDAPLPASFDWRDKGAVTAVKNQGQCGSCWAFSATEAIESQWFLAGHPLPTLSEQQIVDCDQGRGDQGCNGGDTPTAYEYVIAAGGLDTEASYPYTAEDGTCQFKSSDVAAKITSWGYVTQNHNETQMQVTLVAKGPLSICVDASSWQFYEGGVITSECGRSLDHCVMITGFSNKEGWDFETYAVWNIRNSWGADWGYSGYLYVQRGSDLCGVSDEVTLPVV
eukprot:TRINITY_DN266_c0_g1_i1.p1 TRINITY_DN266_c0_g1~~TRINITY_DN266_c0_g1_i1.p1  ORF type:complete len:347 (-),score=46.25 TRINITY_DN266_c0_g1_i1:104-1144(-)